MTDPENQDSHQDERNRLTSLLASIRLKIFRQDFFDSAIKTATIIFPVTAIGVAINQFLGSPLQSWGLILVALGITLARIFHRKECTTAGKRANLLGNRSQGRKKGRRGILRKGSADSLD